MINNKIPRPIRNLAARFGFGVFGSARFGNIDGLIKTTRPSETYSKIDRPAILGGSLPEADIAQADIAVLGQTQGYIKTERPQ